MEDRGIRLSEQWSEFREPSMFLYNFSIRNSSNLNSIFRNRLGLGFHWKLFGQCMFATIQYWNPILLFCSGKMFTFKLQIRTKLKPVFVNDPFFENRISNCWYWSAVKRSIDNLIPIISTKSFKLCALRPESE